MINFFSKMDIFIQKLLTNEDKSNLFWFFLMYEEPPQIQAKQILTSRNMRTHSSLVSEQRFFFFFTVVKTYHFYHV